MSEPTPYQAELEVDGAHPGAYSFVAQDGNGQHHTYVQAEIDSEANA